jgi:predicted ester cyclase
MASATQLSAEVKMTSEPARVVKGFLDDVRSGRDPDAVTRYFASSVRAHQVTSERDVTVVRTPAEYAAHVREFIALFGRFGFRVEEMLTDRDRVYVRWRQTGHHVGSINGEAASGAPLTDISSAVYRVENGRIVEYWDSDRPKGSGTPARCDRRA